VEGATAQGALAWARDRGKLVTTACVAAIALAAWPIQSIRPAAGGDWGWIAGLAYVAEHGMRFGDQIVWTYGPLGFLDTWYGPALYYFDLLALSWLYAALVQVLLAAALLAALRRTLPLAAAAVTAAAVLALVPDPVPALALAWCVAVLVRPDDAPAGRVAAVAPLALGVLAGIALLGKLNQAVEVLALAAIALAAHPRRHDARAFAAALLATAAVGWIATGQTLGDVWPYLRYGVEMVAGYAAAMGTSDPDHGWSYAAAPALIALVLALAWTATRALPRRRRAGMLALYVVYLGMSYKEGFTRQDPGHLEAFFGDALVPLALLPPRDARGRAVVVPALLAIVSAALAIAVLLGAQPTLRRLNPYANVTAAADQLRTIASPARRDAIAAELRAQVFAGYGVPPQVRAAVGQRTVMVWPFLGGEVAYAYRLNLRPLPSFEPYGAYTPALDRLSAEMLASARAPSRIMRAATGGFDGRHPTFVAPLATLEIFCRYRQVAAHEKWQALARGDDRCGAGRPLAVRSAAWGQPVAVPAPRDPDAAVIVHVDGAGPQGLERLRALLLRLQRRWIALDGERFRLVAATAADGLLLSVPPRLDYRKPFAMAPRPRTIAVERDGGQPGGRLVYRFEEIPLRSIPSSAGAP
jgi:hypothetical protein